MKHRIWIVVPLLALFGVSACSTDAGPTASIFSTAPISSTAPAVTTVPGAVAVVTGLEGIEFIVHQVPG